MSERFYVSFPLQVGEIHLEGAEAHHLGTVCRGRVGDRVTLFNGDGNEYHATVQELGRKEVALMIEKISNPERELPFELAVAAPLPKGDRAQFLIEKLTELGVTHFTPLETARSIIHPGRAKIDKLERYVIEASKQCGRNTLMQIDSPEPWSSLCCRDDLPRRRLFADQGGESMESSTAADTFVAIGPEGDWTEEERALAHQHGWKPVGLGPRTLRVETAAIVLATLLAK